MNFLNTYIRIFSVIRKKKVKGKKNLNKTETKYEFFTCELCWGEGESSFVHEGEIKTRGLIGETRELVVGLIPVLVTHRAVVAPSHKHFFYI